MSEIQERIEAWEHRVSLFIEENRPLLGDPELGPDAAQRLAMQTADLLVPLMNELTDTLNDAAKAANMLADAINDPYCSTGKVNEREKEHRRLEAKREKLQVLQDHLLDFQHKVEEHRAKTAAEQLESILETPEDEKPTPRGGTRGSVKHSLWRRFFG